MDRLDERPGRSIREVAKKALSPAVIQEIRRLQAYNLEVRTTYVKLRVLNKLGLTNPKTLRAPITARKFLFVCFGNIMRSPMCEALMNRELAHLGAQPFSVTSAGLNATPGRPAHPWAIAAAHKLGISLEQHRAHLLTSEDVNQADAIFAMDYENQAQLLTRWPNACKKVFMLAAYSDRGYRSAEIPDPYYLGEEQTKRCYETLDVCVRNLAQSVTSQQPDSP